MRAVIQRVNYASVVWKDAQERIANGLLIFLAIHRKDTIEDVKYLSKKIQKLRIFSDSDGLMNNSLKDEEGQVLIVSQFTLYAKTRKGNRPSFTDSARPKQAKKLYQLFKDEFKRDEIKVKSGKFGEHMKVNLENNGPVTIIIDSQDRKLPRKSA